MSSRRRSCAFQSFSETFAGFKTRTVARAGLFATTGTAADAATAESRQNMHNYSAASVDPRLPLAPDWRHYISKSSVGGPSIVSVVDQIVVGN